MSVDQHRSSFHMPRTPSDDLDSCGDWRVETAVKLMREKMSGATTVGVIAEDIGISTSQLSRLFKRHGKAISSVLLDQLALGPCSLEIAQQQYVAHADCIRMRVCGCRPFLSPVQEAVQAISQVL